MFRSGEWIENFRPFGDYGTHLYSEYTQSVLTIAFKDLKKRVFHCMKTGHDFKDLTSDFESRVVFQFFISIEFWPLCQKVILFPLQADFKPQTLFDANFMKLS